MSGQSRLLAGTGTNAALDNLLDELGNRLQAGESLVLEEIVREHPEHEEGLRRYFPALQVLANLNGTKEDTALLGELGDFRLLREVGRGGMGMVYEAEQISLRRRVALKVLPFAATMDPRHLQRFHNEAQAAACLHHTNIVPVYFVGCERGVHFYAMQFIDGQPLSELIRQMRSLEKKNDKTPSVEPTCPYAPPEGAITTSPTVGRSSASTPLTDEGRRGRDYYRKVAELGIQAAEALDHAHQLGIVHRDIKPANLIVDGAGRLWVTDFGLAHMQHNEASLTQTGQAMGTPRYMSPEQALAKRVPIDHRTDIYSLGATLYELLTLRPAFDSEDRQELLRQIAFEDPMRPRRLERTIPEELEVIVLKAMEKRPQDRYATAQELADDLRRWLLDQPIRARRPTFVQRTRRWVRRHQSVVWSFAVCSLLTMAVVGASLGWVAGEHASRKENVAKSFNEAVQNANSFLQAEKWLEAKAAIREAAGLLAGAGGDANQRGKLEQLEADLKMAEALEFARLQRAEAVNDEKFVFDDAWTVPFIKSAFHAYNLPVLEMEPEKTAQLIAASIIREQLFAALVDWTNFTTDLVEKKKVRNLLRFVDSNNPWRRQVWDAMDHHDHSRLLRLAQSEEALSQPPGRLVALGVILARIDKPAAVTLLRQAQQRHRDDFWINQELATYLHHMDATRLEEAIGYYRTAVALRPQSPGALFNLGAALHEKGRVDEAIAEYREAVNLKKDFAVAHMSLGNALKDKGQLDEAISEYGKAIHLKNDYAPAHYNLGNALKDKGQLDEAMTEYRKAIHYQKDGFVGAYINLGSTLCEIGKLDEGIAEFRKAIALKNDCAEAHCNLGDALGRKGRLDEAITEIRKAIDLKNDYVEAHNSLGIALCDMGRADEGIAEYRKAIHLKNDYALAHDNLGNALEAKGRLDEAIAEHHKAIHIKKDSYEAHYNLGHALYTKGQLNEAKFEFQEAIRIKQDFAEAHSILGIVLCDQGEWDESLNESRKAIQLKEDLAEAHFCLGRALYHKGQLNEAILAYRKTIRLKPGDAMAHNNLGVILVDKGKLDEAIGEFREAIRLDKNNASFHGNLGTALVTKGLEGEAFVEWQNVIRLNKNDPGAHYNLGLGHKMKGRWDEAIREFREAIRLKKDHAGAHHNLGFVLVQKGRIDEAIVAIREAIRLKKDIAEAHNDLGACLGKKGQVDESIDEFREAIRLKKDYAEAHYNLGFALAKKGHVDETIAEYRETIRLKEDYAEAHCNLGQALTRQGRFAEALVYYRRGHELGSRQPDWQYPSAAWLRKAEYLADLDGRLPALLKGREQPKNCAERLTLAQICQQHKKLFAVSARWYSEAFAEQPQLANDLNMQFRYNAACAAALAGCGEGNDADKLDAKERARLRRQALDWLRADLNARSKQLKSWWPGTAEAARQILEHWLHDEDFAGVRGEKALAKLPEAERKEWHKLWEEVEALRKPSSGQPKTTGSP